MSDSHIMDMVLKFGPAKKSWIYISIKITFIHFELLAQFVHLAFTIKNSSRVGLIPIL